MSSVDVIVEGFICFERFESVRSAVRACTVWLILISSLLLLFAVVTAAIALHCDVSVRGDVAEW